jgi:hypothetical protein
MIPVKKIFSGIYTRSTSRCRFQPVEKGLGTRHGLKRIVVLLSKSITQEMTLYRLARRELSLNAHLHNNQKYIGHQVMLLFVNDNDLLQREVLIHNR